MVSRVFMITTAYEQGVGKGQQAFNRSTEIENPYSDSECNEAWQLGYEEGKSQASRVMYDEPIVMLDRLNTKASKNCAQFIKNIKAISL